MEQCQRTDEIPPVMSCHFGIFDLCGLPKDIAWYYKAWYRREPVLHLFPHWNWEGAEGSEIEVWTYSNAEEEELWVNGVSQGRQHVPELGHNERREAFAPGRIEAVAYRGGQEVGRALRETAGPAVGLRLVCETGALH